MVFAYTVCDGRRCIQHYLHKPALGHQDSFSGAHNTWSGGIAIGLNTPNHMQTQPVEEGRYRNTLDAIRTIYRSEGISAFYRGLFPSLLGITHVAVQFPLYERLKLWMQDDSRTPLTSSQILACSGSAKMCASIATYPHEVVRTRLQTQRRLLNPTPNTNSTSMPPASNSGLPQPNNGSSAASGPSEAPKQPRGGVIYTVKKIVRKEGWRGLYKGLSVNLIRTVPNSAVTMLTYVHPFY